LFFHLDYGLLAEVFGALLLLAFVLERGLSVLFESDIYAKLHNRGLKAPIAVLGAVLLCWQLHFDALGTIFHQEAVTWAGLIVTGLVIAGGSKAVIKLMHDVLKIPNYTDQLAAVGDPGKIELKPPPPPAARKGLDPAAGGP